MLHFILGPPRSGKSAFAESIVGESSGSTVYIGTLPSVPHYEQVIRCHKVRRPDEWDLIELIGDPKRDFNLISDAVREYKNILIDGISFYLFRLTSMFNEDLDSLKTWSRVLTGQAAAADSQTLVVDPPVISELPSLQRQILLHAHVSIIRRAQVISFVENDRAVYITRNEAIQIDKNSYSYIQPSL